MADDARPDDRLNGDQEDSEIARRKQEFTRRVLLRAGWVVPMETTINIPSASAQTPSPHNDVHGDSPHQDNIIEHLDIHLDTPGPPHQDHSDGAPHGDHSDAATHVDLHGDAHADHGDHDDAHGDFVFNDHTDAGHNDHLDGTLHTDHSDATSHSDHSDSSGPGHLDTQDQHPPHGDHWDVQHRDHDDNNTTSPHDDHGDSPYVDHYDSNHRDHSDAGLIRITLTILIQI